MIKYYNEYEGRPKPEFREDLTLYDEFTFTNLFLDGCEEKQKLDDDDKRMLMSTKCDYEGDGRLEALIIISRINKLINKF